VLKRYIVIVGRRERQQVVDQWPQVVLAKVDVELVVVGAVKVHEEAREILHEVFIECTGGDDLGFGRSEQRTDESDGRQQAKQ